MSRGSNYPLGTNSRPISQESTKGSVSRRSSLKAGHQTDTGRRRMSSLLPDDDEDKASGGAREERATDVASRYAFKVSGFMTHYNEILRRRLIQELSRPAQKVEFPADSTFVLSDDEDEETQKKDTNRKLSGEGPEDKASALDKLKKVSMRSHGLAQIKMRKTVQETQKALRRQQVRRTFQKKVHIIVFCIRCVRSHCFRYRESSELTPYMNTLDYIDYTTDQVSDLMFDRSMYTAQRKMRISEETKKILCTRKSARTEQALYTAMIALRNIRSFAELPVRMQRMIARAGQYESYEGRRVITREGHPASGFYFILSGAVVAMKMDPERPIASAVEHFSKGDTFEENPLVGDSVREVTILTKEPCEFLSISASDYKDIFMQGGVKNLNDPDQESFLSGLSFLQGWPIEKLQDHPKECRFHYFRRGAVLSDDTKTSKWLIIVKSGSLSIMKKLKKVCPFEWRNKSDIKPLTEKERRERMHEKEQWRRYVFSELRLPLKKKQDLEEIEERVDGKPKAFQHPVIKVQKEDGGADTSGSRYYYPNLWTYGRSGQTDDKDNTFSNINKQFLYTMSSSGQTAKDQPVGNATKKSASSSAFVRQPISSGTKVEVPRPVSETRSLASPAPSEVSLRSLLASSLETDYSERPTTSQFDDRLRMIADENVISPGVGFQQISELDLNPQFVKIKTLIKGDVWGLADLMLDEQPSFIIISNGADCVLISKQFYKDHCPEKLQQRLKNDLCPYPSDTRLQDGLQISVDWDEHRRCELSSTMQTVNGRRLLRGSLLSHSMTT